MHVELTFSANHMQGIIAIILVFGGGRQNVYSQETGTSSLVDQIAHFTTLIYDNNINNNNNNNNNNDNNDNNDINDNSNNNILERINNDIFW